MSDFNLAIPFLLQHEGGFVDHPADPGGATNFGISLRLLKQLDAHALLTDIQTLSQADAIKIYEREWWQRYHYATIDSQALATKLLDLSVNMGSHQAHLCLQRAIRAVVKECIIEDGILGTQSFHIINSLDSAILLAAFKSEAAGFYRYLRQPQFENGWLTRAYD